ncbi:MAG: hypothetical protein Q8P80_01715 [Candidatus Levybacteria bacterium]|nr:hypothetical protein [Candidatus Levybacteria bacterium]
MKEDSRLHFSEEVQKAAKAFALEIEQNLEDFTGSLIINHTVPCSHYSSDEQLELLRQAEELGYVPSDDWVEKDEEWSLETGKTSCDLSLQDVIAQHVRRTYPAVAFMEEKREKAFKAFMEEQGFKPQF